MDCSDSVEFPESRNSAQSGANGDKQLVKEQPCGFFDPSRDHGSWPVRAVVIVTQARTPAASAFENSPEARQ
jgi:hypothetical protein